jgi:hypothetical protein
VASHSPEQLQRAAEEVGKVLEQTAHAVVALRDATHRTAEQNAVLENGMLHLRLLATFLLGGPKGGRKAGDIQPADFLEGRAEWLPPSSDHSAWYGHDDKVINPMLMHLSWQRVTGAAFWSLPSALSRALRTFEAFVAHLEAESAPQREEFSRALAAARAILA